MSINQVREYFKKYNRDQDIIELNESSATVELAALALGTKPERIAKSLSFMVKDHAIIIVCAGDCKVNNQAYKEMFGTKAKMLKPEEVEIYTNHPIGGVCPFAICKGTDVYLDVSLKRFEYVYPACGSSNSAIKLTCDEMEQLIPESKWINVCKIQ